MIGRQCQQLEQVDLIVSRIFELLRTFFQYKNHSIFSNEDQDVLCNNLFYDFKTDYLWRISIWTSGRFLVLEKKYLKINFGKILRVLTVRIELLVWAQEFWAYIFGLKWSEQWIKSLKLIRPRRFAWCITLEQLGAIYGGRTRAISYYKY